MATEKHATDDAGALVRADIAKVETALTEFDKISAGLAELRTKHEGVVFEVKTPAGMKLATTARAEIRAPRYATETIRKAAKAPVLALGRNIDERAAWITAELLKIETPIQEQIAAEEERKETERARVENAEKERIARIQAGIEELKQIPLEAQGQSAAQLAETMDRLEQVQVGAWAFEFADVAEAMKVRSMNMLRIMHTATAEREAESARLKAERDELEQRRAEQDAREKAEAARVAEENRKRETDERARLDRIAAEERASKDRIAEQERQARAARDAEEDRLRAVRQEEEEKLRKEREHLEKERLAKEARDRAASEKAEAKAKAKRDKEEAAQREAERKQRYRLETDEMLVHIRDRIEGLEQYAGIAKAIDAYTAKVEKEKVAA